MEEKTTKTNDNVSQTLNIDEELNTVSKET